MRIGINFFWVFAMCNLGVACKISAPHKTLYSITWVASCTDSLGNATSKTIFAEYYENDTLSEEITFDEKGAKHIEQRKYFNKKGKEIKREVIVGTEIIDGTLITRDSLGNEVEIQTYDGRTLSDTITFNCKNKFDASGKIINSDIYWKDSLQSSIKYYYSGDKIVKSETYTMISDSLKLQSIESWTYDNNGHIIEDSSEQLFGKNNTRVVCTYNRSRMISKKIYRDANLIGETDFFYKSNKRDYAIKYDYINGTNCRIVFKYEYL